MSFFGKEYTFVREENFDNFVNALGLSAEHAQAYHSYRPDQKLVQNGDSYTLSTTTAKGTKEQTFKNGVTLDDKVADRNSKTTFTLEGNTLTQVHKFEDGGELSVFRTFSDSELVVELKTNKTDVSARRYYKA